MSKLKFPLNIQTFAEGDGGDPGAQGNQHTQSVDFDYERLADIVSKRSASAEDSVLKGFFKQQGLSQEDATQAMQDYKASQIAKKKEQDEAGQKLADENAQLRAKIQKSEIDSCLTSIASSEKIGVQADKVPFLLRLVDQKDLLKEDGTVDEEKATTAIEEITKAFPDFKTETTSSGFTKVGGNKEGTSDKEDEEMKKWRKDAGLD